MLIVLLYRDLIRPTKQRISLSISFSYLLSFLSILSLPLSPEQSWHLRSSSVTPKTIFHLCPSHTTPHRASRMFTDRLNTSVKLAEASSRDMSGVERMLSSLRFNESSDHEWLHSLMFPRVELPQNHPVLQRLMRGNASPMLFYRRCVLKWWNWLSVKSIVNKSWDVCRPLRCVCTEVWLLFGPKRHHLGPMVGGNLQLPASHSHETKPLVLYKTRENKNNGE